MQNFMSFLMVLIFFENFEKFSKGAFYHLSKMSLEGTIVPGRLRSELCPWGVKTFNDFALYKNVDFQVSIKTYFIF